MSFRGGEVRGHAVAHAFKDKMVVTAQQELPLTLHSLL